MSDAYDVLIIGAGPGGYVAAIRAALDEVVRLKPASSKGRYIQKGAVSTTFGPGIPLDVNSIA